MSYCRFSSGSFSSDIYCYLSNEGYTICVAQNRIMGDIPKVPSMDNVPNEEWLEAHQRMMGFIQNAERRSIGLQYDGQTFIESTPHEAAVRLLALRDEGYNVPQHAIDSLQEEAKDEQEPHNERMA